MGSAPSPGVTYLLVDGENVDATLGNDILKRRPTPDERPRWDRVMEFLRQEWGQEVRALFFLNATSGHLPMPFVQALLALGYRVIPLAGAKDEKVVDIGIQRTLVAMAERAGDVALASHDADFEPQLRALLNTRRVAILGFREFVSQRFADMELDGLAFFDMEATVRAFNAPLPRVRIIPLDDFDPVAFLD
jgi:putative heme uptake system protein